MAEEPTEKDAAKLDAKIKELMQRADALDASADELHQAAKAAQTESAARAKELSNIKERKK